MILMICERGGKNYSRMCVESMHRLRPNGHEILNPMDNRYSEKADEFQRPPQKKDPFIWNQFRMVKNQVNWEINSAKKAYYENAFNNCCEDQRKTWKAINELTWRKSNKTLINEMEYYGVNSGDQTDIAQMLNSFFTEIGPSLSGLIQ